MTMPKYNLWITIQYEIPDDEGATIREQVNNVEEALRDYGVEPMRGSTTIEIEEADDE